MVKFLRRICSKRIFQRLASSLFESESYVFIEFISNLVADRHIAPYFISCGDMDCTGSDPLNVNR